MPRRRRNSAFEKKPKLVFTESPVHVQKNIPSPVLCARCPPTATAVQIEELNAITWVSPQFKQSDVRDRCANARHGRQRRHSEAAHSSIKPLLSWNKENSATYSVTSRLKKYRSLKFLGDTTSMTSIVENISNDSETETEHEANDKDVDIESDKSPASCDINGTNQFTLLRKNASPEGCTAKIDDIHYTGADSGAETNSCHTVATDTCAHSEPDHNKVTAPVKRLFASQLGASVTGINIGVESSSEQEQPLHDIRSSVVLQDLRVEETSEEDARSPAVQKYVTSGLRRSARIKLMQKLFAVNSSPESAPSPRSISVLVPDTPEAQYGWSIRKKQLKKQNVHTSCP